jgi:hypothetical protein
MQRVAHAWHVRPAGLPIRMDEGREMEQLGGPEISALLARAREQGSRPDPWTRAPNSPVPDHAPGRSGYPPPPGAALLPADDLEVLAPLGGIERRLVLRAERYWEAARVAPALPSADAAAGLLCEPFARHALLIAVRQPEPAADAAPAAAVADILYIGEDIARLGLATEGPIIPDNRPGAQLDQRLAALAVASVCNRRPDRLSSESIHAAPGDASGSLLLRAIALPVAVDDTDGAAIVILSWRKLLSPDETAALHHELEAAMDWILKQRPDRH